MSLNIRKTTNATFTAPLDFVEPLNANQTAITNTVYYIAYVGNDNKKHYCPGLRSDSSTLVYNGKIYLYNSGFKTIFFKAPNGTIYRLPNAYISNYDIPAGTYTPSAFRNLISQYISENGTRKCANAFTAKVNNQTISVSSGQTIAYKHCGSSPWIGTFVDFSGSTSNVNAYSASNSFTNNKAYCVGLSDSRETGGGTGSYPNMFHSFANYSITITAGIKFV